MISVGQVVKDTNMLDIEEILDSREYSEDVREIVAYLWRVTERAGGEMRAYSTRKGARHITGKLGKRVICWIDPKPQANHVGVCIPGADERVLVDAGRVHRRKNNWPWVHIENMRGAERLESEIRGAYERIGRPGNT
jgi:hypothetical protein